MKCENPEQVRENIERIDTEIIRLIAERNAYMVQASAFKKDEKSVRENVIEKVRKKAEEFGVNPDMIELLYREMIAGFVKAELQEFSERGGR